MERDFFKQPFSREEILDLVGKGQVSDMFSSRSPAFKKLGLNVKALDDNEMVELMLEEPRLIRRPVVRIDGVTYSGANEARLREILE